VEELFFKKIYDFVGENNDYAEFLRDCHEKVIKNNASNTERILGVIYQQMIFRLGTPDSFKINCSSVANILYTKEILNTFSSHPVCLTSTNYAYLGKLCQKYLEQIILNDYIYKDFLFDEICIHVFHYQKPFMHRELSSLLFKYYCEGKYIAMLLELTQENTIFFDSLHHDMTVKWAMAHLAMMNLCGYAIEVQRDFAFQYCHLRLIDKWLYTQKPVEIIKILQLFAVK
jgi:hypothetical protein